MKEQSQLTQLINFLHASMTDSQLTNLTLRVRRFKKEKISSIDVWSNLIMMQKLTRKEASQPSLKLKKIEIVEDFAFSSILEEEDCQKMYDLCIS
jgi:hypothetical protein